MLALMKKSCCAVPVVVLEREGTRAARLAAAVLAIFVSIRARLLPSMRESALRKCLFALFTDGSLRSFWKDGEIKNLRGTVVIISAKSGLAFGKLLTSIAGCT